MTNDAKPDFNFEGFVCPLPLRDYPQIVMGHGSGGRMSNDLVKHLFLPLFDNAALRSLNDQAVLAMPLDGGRLAFTTDSFVVNPLFFPGGDIGQLAVHGTVNDLAVSGATPLYLSAGFILEEGLKMDTLGQIVTNMARAAQEAGVQVVTGDTKVVERGHGDGLYINTSGVGIVPPGVDIAAQNIQPGDAVIVSGMLGDHGVAVMSVREGLDFDVDVASDTAPLNGLVAAMLEASANIHAMRDCTRGGLAASLNELAQASRVGVVFDERAAPVRPAVRAACEMLGLDPLYVANEGKLVAFVARADADAVLAAMRAHPLGADAAIIGEAAAEHPGLVAARTGIGGRRVVDMPLGVLLPRIC
ncbi:MAG: hydrogenase expression/formation protein HypE [Anaerolineae bacterium]|nr:hydrogenase expression/formation protein HypE [Anaerolineae bacterium]